MLRRSASDEPSYLEDVIGERKRTWAKKGRPSSLSAATAVPHTDRLRSELSPPFFSCPPPMAASPFGRADKGPSFDPQASWPAHLVHPCKRCGSGRVAPTFRTAPRGAKSGRLEHATGSNCPDRVATGISRTVQCTGHWLFLPRRSFRTEVVEAAPDEFCFNLSVEPKIGPRANHASP